MAHDDPRLEPRRAPDWAGVARDALARAARAEPLHVFSALLDSEAAQAVRALARAQAAGAAPGPLAGVPFVIKNLFDLRGRPTLAGAQARLGEPPAPRHAAAVRALLEAGAIPVGLTHMDEYACGATGENVIGGPVRNPLDPGRIAGGSSAGTAAAIAAGIVPLGLGSDTNGSIRAPAAFCGIWGLRPGAGALSAEGCFPYAESLDAVGPMASDARLLARAYAVLRGRPPDEAGLLSIAGLRAGILRAGFGDFATAAANAAVARVAEGFASARHIDLPDAEQARAAATLISTYEAGRNHARRGFARRHAGYTAVVRQRMLAGIAVPREWYEAARAWQRAWRERLAALFQEVDVLLACATPYAATPLGAESVILEGRRYAPRADAGHMTRPVSLAGLPVVAAPCAGPGLPLGVQLIGPPDGEALCLRAARALQAQGLCRSRVQPWPAEGR